MRTTWILLAVVASALTLAGLPFVGTPSGVATSTVQEGGATTEQQFAQAARWRRVMKPEQAVEVYRQLAQDPDLTPEERTRAAYLAAQTLEFIPGQGEAARQAYLDFRNAHPDEPLGWEAAGRLGNLYDNILLGLKRDEAKAQEQYEWVIAHAPANTLVALSAHLYLGGLLSRKGQRDQAIAHYETIYAADPDDVDTPPIEACLFPKQRGVARGVVRMQVSAVDLMVGACRARRGEAAVTALKALVEKYQDDAFVREEAEKALKEAEDAAQSAVSPEEAQGTPFAPGLIVLLDGYWEPDPLIDSPEITAPADGTYVYAGQEVACACTRTTEDWDTFCEGENRTEFRDDLIDASEVEWFCTEGVGGWGEGGNKGLNVTWIAAQGTTQCHLKVQDNDAPTEEGRDDDDEASSAMVMVAPVRVDHIEYQDPVEGWIGVADWEMEEGELYVPLGARCSFRACHNPNVEGWPAGKPTWGGTAEGETNGDMRDVTLTTLDPKTISASCGNTVTLNVAAVKVSKVQYNDPDLGYTTCPARCTL
jgi:tetratricopeptide (TPR) repeat protein